MEWSEWAKSVNLPVRETYNPVREMGFVRPKPNSSFYDELSPEFMHSVYGNAVEPNSSVAVKKINFFRKHWKLGIAAVGLIGLTGWAFSGRDDESNNISGLLHGGSAQQMRRSMTPFGSGWDPLRNLVSKHIGTEAGAFSKFISSSGFRESLNKGKIIKELGQGAYGEAHLMGANINIGDSSHYFEYVRKTPLIASEKTVANEVASMSALGDLNAPTFYGMNEQNQFFMEHFKGEMAHQIMLSGRSLKPETIADLKQFVTKSHERGIAHTDMIRDVSLLNKNLFEEKGFVGEYVPHNVIITPEGRAGVIDYGMATSATAVSGRNEAGRANPVMRTFDAYTGKPNIGKPAANLDNLLIAGLERQQGGITPEFIAEETRAALRTTEGSISSKSSAATATIGGKIRKVQMAQSQYRTTQMLFEDGRSGGKRSKSAFISARKTI